MAKKNKLAAIAMLLLLVWAAGCSEGANVVGRVNGEEITSAQYDKVYKQVKASTEYSKKVVINEKEAVETVAQLKEQAFNECINMIIIKQEAKKRGITTDKEAIDDQIVSIKASLTQQGSSYETLMKTLSLTDEDVREQLELAQYRDKIKEQMAGEITVADADIQEYYQANQAQYSTEGGIQIYHILVDSQAKAEDIIKQIQAGADFGDMARQYSSCSSASKGGDLGVTNENTNFVPEFKAAALALKPGEMTLTPVKSEFGYHIIKAGQQVLAGVQPLESVRGQIEASLKEKKADQAVTDYLAKLRTDAVVEDLRTKG